MPLYLSKNDQAVLISSIKGNDKIKAHLKNMGFIVGEKIFVVSKIDKNIIVKVKGVSVALSHDLAKRIYI